MNTTNGALDFELMLKDNQFNRVLQENENRIRSFSQTSVNEVSKVDKAFSGMGLAAIGGTAAIGMLGKDILDTTAKFEKFGIVLKNTLGDAKGAEALNMIANFAATTPFQLDEVTGAFIKMANQGFVPTQAEMIKLGDLASSTGKGFDQLTEAILDAQTGEYERLKEFGIKASSSGDKVTFSFKEQQTTVENTNSAIRGYILSLGELKGVAGANEKISASLTGQISNLGDKLAAMYNKIGSDNKGLLYGAVGGASMLIDNYEALGEVLKGLILVYGIHRVTAMAVAYQENAKAAAIARNMAIETEYTAIMATQNTMMMGRAQIAAIEANARVAATESVILAEKELQATTKASTLTNPYALAAMAVATLGYAIYKVVSYHTDLQKATAKAATEISNEKDKAAALFAELNNAAEGTENWKTARQGILDQYGTYLTGQEKELSNAQLIGEAYKKVGEEIEKTIGIKVRKEALTAVSTELNPKIEDSKKSLSEGLARNMSREDAAKYNLKAGTLIEVIKYQTDPVEKAKAIAEFKELEVELRKLSEGAANQFAYSSKNIISYLDEYATKTAAINKAFTAEASKADATKPDPILTTYAAQIEALKKKKVIAEKELAELKSKPGVDPLKDITAKQDEIDEINKQLGIKKKKEEEEVAGAYNKIEAAIKKASEAVVNASEKERPVLQEKLSALVKQRQAWEDLIKAQRGETTGLKPIQMQGATVSTKILDTQLKPMKQLTDEQRKQLELKSKQTDLDLATTESYKKQIELIQQVVGFIDESINKYGEMLGLSKDQQSLLADGMKAMSGMAQIASGNVLQGSFTLISSLADALIKKPEKMSEIFEGINQNIQKVIKSLDLAGETFSNLNKDASGASLKVVKAQLLDLADSAKLLNEELAKSSTGRRRTTDMNLPNIIKQAADINTEIEKLTARLLQGDISDEQRTAIEAILESYNSLLAKIDSTIREITGTTVSDFSRSISDSILDGAEAWDVWGQKATDVIKNVVSKQLTAKLLNSPITDAVNALVNDSANGLTPEEAKAFQDSIKGIYENVAPAYQAAVDSLKAVGIDLSDSVAKKSVTGVSASATEETMNAMVGQTMAMRVDLKDMSVSLVSLKELGLQQVNILDASLFQLIKIGKNTDELGRLANLENKLDIINDTLKKGLA